MSTFMFDELRARLPQFRRSEQKVARFVLRHAEEVLNLRLADLAKRVNVSEPTVIRFCRAIDCEGYQDFKLRLAQTLATGAQFSEFSMNETDSVADFSRSIFDSTVGTLLSVRDRLDANAISEAIAALAEANRVEFYGFGASGAVAVDAQHKFFRLRISTTAYSDPHMQHMSAVTLTEHDVVVAISQTGRTRSLLSSVEIALEHGATVIGLCPAGSPLAQLCSVGLYIDVFEDREVYRPLSSRIAHLVMIDILAVGVARSRGPQLTEHLMAVKRSLVPLRTDERDPFAQLRRDRTPPEDDEV
ncbi:transcriptional regulator HexR [Kushneria phosphatilytica]|uniref:Transcriptional regulator HexR n=1 Tax=Kushneria phosphatilytica TaxID=657387 RepID=A0A1S1NNG8_9GAMM|nr:transcriptional regulator HexR [Kushneria phosphatilytica]OHV08867.1 transcriptional regulator [Kushneria phosphatilytica]QEL12589.1 transcriptional regulator HexR [Kushneria phosphatilytica]